MEHFKERANDIILGSQFSLKIGILIETQDWDTKAFVLKIVLIPAHIRLIWLINLLTFVCGRIFLFGKKINDRHASEIRSF